MSPLEAQAYHCEVGKETTANVVDVTGPREGAAAADKRFAQDAMKALPCYNWKSVRLRHKKTQKRFSIPSRRNIVSFTLGAG